MAHIGHNVLEAYVDFTFNDHMSERQYGWYKEHDQKKIVVSTSIETMRNIIESLSHHIPYSMVDDVNYKYPICAVVGPVSDEESYHYGLADLPLYRG